MVNSSAPANAPWRVQRDLFVQLAEPAVIFGVALLALGVLRQIALRWLRCKAAGPESPAAVLAGAVRIPSLLWCLAGALAVALRFAELTERQIHLAGIWIVIFLIVSLSLVGAAAAVRMVALYGQRRNMPFAVAGLSRTLTHIVVLSVGAMVLMHYLGLDIRPMLTALGVGGLALALALQDTLANMFAGIHILIEEPISPGHFIRLASGEEGTVADIGWRTTRIRTGTNNIIVVPNTKITSGILINFSLPELRAVIEIPVYAGRDADAARVREIILEEALETEGVLPDPAPLVLFDPGPTPAYQHFRLFVHIERQVQRGLVASAVNLRLTARFRAEGVPLPADGQTGLLRA
ncbi:MAG: mechanosensitive ion channel family protein [Acidobacteria bacterium]|nr:mechanosensitive ion channel family protein [Acidobacteriota bacterium]